MMSTQHYESQEVQNNMNSGIREHFIELCISILLQDVLGRVYK